MERLSRQVALITGGACGLGKAIARRLADEGARVVISDVQEDVGEATARELGVSFLRHDVTDEAQWRDVVMRVRERFERLTILINNAGIVGPSPQLDPVTTQIADWKRVFAVNVDGVFLGCREAIPAMKQAGGGSIVNISSVAGFLATPYATAYGATKAAVRQITKSVAQHCAQSKLNIRCNSVHPGIMRTPLWEGHAERAARHRNVPLEEIVKETQTTIPLGDFTLPEDVAAAVAFLVSADSRHVTGAALAVDGGILHCDTYRNRPARQ